MKKILLVFTLIALAAGGWYWSGKGVDETARLQAAAESGDADAQVRYASLMLTGEPPDTAGAIWLIKAAGQGDDRARLALALMHIAGQGIAKDDEAAGRLFLDMAENGNAAAQALAGDIFERGWSVPESVDLAARFYRQAAKGGSNQARHRLWQMLLTDRIAPSKIGETITLSKNPFETDRLATLFQIAATQRYLSSPDGDGGVAEREAEVNGPLIELLDGLTGPSVEAGFLPALIEDAQQQVLFSDAERLGWQLVLERHDLRVEKGRAERLAATMTPDRVAIAEELADQTTAKLEKAN